MLANTERRSMTAPTIAVIADFSRPPIAQRQPPNAEAMTATQVFHVSDPASFDCLIVLTTISVAQKKATAISMNGIDRRTADFCAVLDDKSYYHRFTAIKFAKPS